MAQLYTLTEREQRVVDILYHDCAPAITKTIYSFMRKYGGDLDELHSLALYTFVDAFQRYNPEKNDNFEAYSCWLIHCKMLDKRRQQLQRNTNHPMYGGDSLEGLSVEPSSFDYKDYLDGLDDDTRTVVELAMTVPEPIAKRMRRSVKVENVGKAVRDHLALDLSWESDRLDAAFAAAGAALV